jgi:hypothetical protein
MAKSTATLLLRWLGLFKGIQETDTCAGIQARQHSPLMDPLISSGAAKTMSARSPIIPAPTSVLGTQSSTQDRLDQ